MQPLPVPSQMRDMASPVLTGTPLTAFAALYQRLGSLMYGALKGQNNIQALTARSWPEHPS
jgi:hypothetical protein